MLSYGLALFVASIFIVVRVPNRGTNQQKWTYSVYVLFFSPQIGRRNSITVFLSIHISILIEGVFSMILVSSKQMSHGFDRRNWSFYTH